MSKVVTSAQHNRCGSRAAGPARAERRRDAQSRSRTARRRATRNRPSREGRNQPAEREPPEDPGAALDGRRRGTAGADRAASSSGKKAYEAELLPAQVELVKWQEWIKARGLQVVVIFEGRDAAGKGGVIKRIIEPLNPRYAPRRRPPGADRAREDPVVLPALRGAPAGRRRDRPLRPQLVQPGRRRAGDGLLHRGRVPGVPAAPARSSSGCSCGRDHPRQVLVLRQRRGAGAALPGPPQRPDQALEAVADGPRVAPALGGLLARPRTRCSPTRTSSRRPGTWSARDDKKRARLNSISHLLSLIPYEDLTPRADRAAAAPAGQRLRAAADGGPDLHPRAVLSAATAPRSGSETRVRSSPRRIPGRTCAKGAATRSRRRPPGAYGRQRRRDLGRAAARVQRRPPRLDAGGASEPRPRLAGGGRPERPDHDVDVDLALDLRGRRGRRRRRARPGRPRARPAPPGVA